MKQDRRITKTKNAIHEAFFEIIEHKELNDISVTELCKKADIDRKTFYLHYHTVNDIIEEYKNDVYSDARKMIQNIDADDLTSLFSGYSSILTKNMTFYKFFVKGAVLENLQIEFKDMLKENFLDKYKPRINVSKNTFTMYTEFIASGTVGLYIDWLRNPNGMTLEKMTANCVEVTKSCWQDYLKMVEK